MECTSASIQIVNQLTHKNNTSSKVGHCGSMALPQSKLPVEGLSVIMTINILFKTQRIKAKIYNIDSMQTLMARVSTCTPLFGRIPTTGPSIYLTSILFHFLKCSNQKRRDSTKAILR